MSRNDMLFLDRSLSELVCNHFAFPYHRKHCHSRWWRLPPLACLSVDPQPTRGTYSMRKKNIFVIISHWDFRVVKKHNLAHPVHPPALPTKHSVIFLVLHVKKQKTGRLILLSYKGVKPGFKPQKYGSSICALSNHPTETLWEKIQEYIRESIFHLLPLNSAILLLLSAQVASSACCIAIALRLACENLLLYLWLFFLSLLSCFLKLSKGLIGKDTWEVNFWRPWIFKNIFFFPHCDG